MDEPISFRIAPELRRSAYYVLAASVPLALVCFWVSRFVGDPLASGIVRSAFIFLLCMTMFVPLRWALRIDHQGVSRRLLLRWDSWLWAGISSGRIEKRHPYTLVDPARPWWRRRLSLGSMQAADIACAMKQINKHYRLPDPPDVPEGLEIKYGFRRLALFDARGIHLRGAKEIGEYLWSEVRRMHITRMDPLRRDFASLEIVLPDRKISLKLISTEYGTFSSWRGAAAEVVDEFLLRHLPNNRIETDVVGERPARRTDVEKQLAETKERWRSLCWCLGFFGAVLVGALIWAWFAGGFLMAAVVNTLYAIPTVPVIWFLGKRFRSRCLELEGQLTSFEGTGHSDTT